MRRQSSNKEAMQASSEVSALFHTNTVSLNHIVYMLL